MSQNEKMSFPKLINPKSILFSEERCGEFQIGALQINRPQALNALDSECYKLMEERLLLWQSQPDLALVILEAVGDKAFCAGGDVKNLVLKLREGDLNTARDFFTREYFIDYLLHVYKKPVVALVDGICMGGGVGLMHGATVRVATERLTLAMPEVAIGLFPDVGATYFLSQLKYGFGLVLGLTGLRITGPEAVELGVVDGMILSSQVRKVRADLMRLPWTGQYEQDQQILRGYFQFQEPPASDFFKEWQEMAPKIEHHNYVTWEKSFLAVCPNDPRWQEVKNRLLAGSPLSRQLFFAAYQKHQNYNWRQVFLAEWEMALQMSREPEFLEGVRAVLIDKDQKPRWRFTNDQQIEVTPYFHLPQGEPHLLAEKLLQLGF